MSTVLVAPARRLFVHGHIPAEGGRTVCGEDTTVPGELWQDVPPELAHHICPACAGTETELTLI